MNVTFGVGPWSCSRELMLRDLLWVVPLVLLSCGVC